MLTVVNNIWFTIDVEVTLFVLVKCGKNILKFLQKVKKKRFWLNLSANYKSEYVF